MTASGTFLSASIPSVALVRASVCSTTALSMSFQVLAALLLVLTVCLGTDSSSELRAVAGMGKALEFAYDGSSDLMVLVGSSLFNNTALLWTVPSTGGMASPLATWVCPQLSSTWPTPPLTPATGLVLDTKKKLAYGFCFGLLLSTPYADGHHGVTVPTFIPLSLTLASSPPTVTAVDPSTGNIVAVTSEYALVAEIQPQTGSVLGAFPFGKYIDVFFDFQAQQVVAPQIGSNPPLFAMFYRNGTVVTSGWWSTLILPSSTSSIIGYDPSAQRLLVSCNDGTLRSYNTVAPFNSTTTPLSPPLSAPDCGTYSLFALFTASREVLDLSASCLLYNGLSSYSY